MSSLFKLEMFNKPFLASVLMMAAFMVIIIILFPITYHTVDDVGMAMRVSGISKTDTPSEFIMNSNILLGRALSGLYNAFPNFDWYPGYLMLMVFISGIAIIFAVLRLRFSFQAFAACVLFLFLIVSFYITELSFTTIASLLGMGGAALVLSILFKPPTKQEYVAFVIGAVILFILSALLREKTFLLIGGLTLIVAVIALWFNHNMRRVLICAIIGFSSFGIGGALIAYDRHSYKVNEAMHEFIVQKKIKSRFTEYGQINFNENNRHIFKACNVSENDFMMMRLWFYDTRIENFSVDKIQCLAEGFPKRKQNVDLGKVIKNVVTIYQQHNLILVFVLGLGLLAPRSPPKIILVICACTLPALVFAYLHVFYKPVLFRISTPVFGFFATMVLVAHMADNNTRQGRQKVKQKYAHLVLNSLAIFMMICATGWQFNKRIVASHLVEVRQNKLQKYTAELNPLNADIYLVWTGDTYPIGWISPFGGVRKLFSHYHQVGVGTSFNSPLSRAQLQRFNLNNPYVDIVNNEHVKFMLRARNADKLFLVYKEFLQINYEIQACFMADKKIDYIVVGSVKTGNQCDTF